MRIAVLTCTRDRLEYTRHCFARLRELAGCEYDHYVFDNGSSDGTVEWLEDEYASSGGVWKSPANVGIWVGFNRLIQLAGDDYDAYVTFDNDCEVLTPGVLRDVAGAALDEDMLLAPKIHGLRNPPPVLETVTGCHGRTLELTAVIGNIFMAIPAWVVEERRFPDGAGPFDETCKPWGGDDEGRIADWMRQKGCAVGYVADHHANHYRTTDGQHDDFPDYFARRVAEGGPA